MVVTGEFGRTPRIGASTGNNNTPRRPRPLVGRLLGRLRRRRASGAARSIGQSDRIGAYPASRPYTPADFAATVYQSLGIDPATEVRDRLDRPIRLCTGEPIAPLFSAARTAETIPRRIPVRDGSAAPGCHTVRRRPSSASLDGLLGLVDQHVDPVELLVGDLEGLAVDRPELLDQLVDAPLGLVPGHDQGVIAPGLDLEPQVEQVGLDLDAVLRRDRERPANQLDREACFLRNSPYHPP